MRVRATRDFRANVAGFVQDFAEGQELEGETGQYLADTGAPVELVDEEPDEQLDLQRPAVRDSKDTWIEYAVAQGMDRDEAEKATKEQLVDRFKDA
jgi:translation elongation factor P/translation initiation factor 5A